jgi:hypothetical protein
MGIELHIDELVLHGFAARDRHRIAAAVQLELARLIAADGHARLVKTPLAVESIDGGAFKVPAGAKPQAAGTQIARALYRSMGRNTRAGAVATGTQPGHAGAQR